LGLFTSVVGVEVNMADAHGPADNGDPDRDEENRDEELQDQEEFEPPQSLIEYLEYWHRWYCIIVHRGENLVPRQAHQYIPEYVSDAIRPAPFPFSIEATWSCGALLALVIAVHHGIDEGWLFEDRFHHYVQWIGRVLGRALLTLGISIFSTLCFEIAGSILSMYLFRVANSIQDWISTELIRRFHWGQVDGNGEPLRDADGDFVWLQGTTFWESWRELAREGLHSLAISIFDDVLTLSIVLSTHLFKLFGRRAVAPALHFLFSIPPDLVVGLPSWLALPTPGSDDIREPRELWFEYGVPVVVQFALLVFLWLLKILYMAQAERVAMHGWRAQDPKMELTWHLIRASAMHLIAYTAYQIVCGVIVALEFSLPKRSWYINFVVGPIVPFLGRILPNGRIFAATLLFFFHWLLRAASLLGVCLARPFWIPYILWQTRYSSDGIGAYWPLFVEHLANDLTVLESSKRVVSRVLMTALFGLSSSWPARFHLSNNEVVDDL
jgi:hypothetical protein